MKLFIYLFFFFLVLDIWDYQYKNNCRWN